MSLAANSVVSGVVTGTAPRRAPGKAGYGDGLAVLTRVGCLPSGRDGAFPGNHAVSLLPPKSLHHVPLSMRCSDELRMRADELAQMAATASTADVRIALESLARRFAVLATKREAAEAQEISRQPENHLSEPTQSASRTPVLSGE